MGMKIKGLLMLQFVLLRIYGVDSSNLEMFEFGLFENFHKNKELVLLDASLVSNIHADKDYRVGVFLKMQTVFFALVVNITQNTRLARRTKNFRLLKNIHCRKSLSVPILAAIETIKQTRNATK